MSSSQCQLFLRPMEHCPDVAVLKSPKQSLMEQLGLNGEDLNNQTSSSDSDTEGQVAHSPVVTPVHLVCSDQSRLKQLLKATQRKLHIAQSSLTDSEHNREKRLKIMRKTHQSALALKQALIQQLQDIIVEKDETICHLKSKHMNDLNTESNTCVDDSQGGLHKLVQQLTDLQKEHTALLERCENISEDLKHSEHEKEKLKDLLMVKDIATKSPLRRRPANDHMPQQIKDLQLKVAQLERERSAVLSHVDTEKELQAKIVQLKSQLSASLTEQRRLEEQVKKTNEANVMLRARNEALQSDIEKKHCEVSTLQSSLSEETDAVSSLTKKLTLEQDRLMCLNAEYEEVKRNLQLLEKKVEIQQGLVSDSEAGKKEAQRECQKLRQQIECMRLKHAQEMAMNNNVERLRNSLSEVSLSVCDMKEVITGTRHYTVEFMKALQRELSLAIKKICARLSTISEENSSLIVKYRREMALRKRLHNKLIDLKGNIRVFCRIRPRIAEDGTGSSAALVVEPDSDDDGLLRVYNRNTWKNFEMDKVFSPSSTQEQVFSEVKDLVTSCTDGYNVCIFAYGQTGSGKTFTMEGTVDNPGINQRALLELFDVVEQRRLDWDYNIIVSVLEVYNETVRDLLSVNFTEKMDIKQGAGGVYVPGLTQVSVTCLEEINEVFALGHVNRSTGATKMNIQSSRSHALLCVTVIGASKTTGVQTFGKLNLIDLAGSERVAKSGSDGDRLQEAKHINRSLSALGDVIHSLKSRSPHIPYRNSKLTHLLQDSLGGDSKTLMVVQIAPVEKNVGETVCSLNFAQRVRAVELGQATKRIVDSATEK